MASSGNSSVPPMAWKVQRYSRREGTSWVTIDDGTSSYTLHCKASQLLLIQSGTVLESFHLGNHSQLNAIVKGDTLLVAARHESVTRKFKIRFISTQTALDCVKFLQHYFPVKDVTKPEENIPITLGEMFQKLMETSPQECLPNPEPIPASFPLEESLQMCILDPSFPGLVSRVAEIMKKLGHAPE